MVVGNVKEDAIGAAPDKLALSRVATIREKSMMSPLR